METISAPRLWRLASILALLAWQAPAHATEDCVTVKTQPNVRRQIEKLARIELGGSTDRSTFSYCGFYRYEVASVAGTWQPQSDGSRTRHLVTCQREYATPKKPWTCSKAPEREVEVAIPGRAGAPLVADIDVELPLDLVRRLIQRAFEAAPDIQSTRQCDDFKSGPQRAEEVRRAFADPGSEMVFVHKSNERLLVGREYTMIVFKLDPQDQDRFELYCWYTYEEL